MPGLAEKLKGKTRYMNTGQMFMTIGAMILLSTLILRVNSNFANNTTTVYNSKFVILAASVGGSVIEEAMGKAFDEKTVNSPISSPNNLTSPNKLGPESGEVYPNFDDFDDYNGYTKIDSSMPSAVFKVTCVVTYVNPNTPDVNSSSATWSKKISVTVTSASMSDTVRLSSLFSYWVFN
jgi:MSHA pilin protein MshD